MKTNRKYQIALSFAGEDREYVEQVAEFLKVNDVEFFYDSYEQVDLWGRNLLEHLMEVYFEKAEYTIMFISKYYAEKIWTNHERRSAQARALEQTTEYILPARFDDTEIPGLLKTVGYVDLRNFSPRDFGKLILQKIGQLNIIENTGSEKKSSRINRDSKIDLEQERKFLQQLIDFAFSSSGMDMTKQDATNWALGVVNEKPYDEIPEFLNNLKLLLKVAFSSSYMDMTKSDSRKWALKVISQVDEDIVQQLVTEIKKLIKFSFSTSGMNMTKEQARSWTLAKIEDKYFT